MLRKILLPVVFVILAYGFWVSPDFKEIAAGVAIFLFGMLFLEDGFKVFTGGVLEVILKNTTDKLWKSIGFGVVSTTIMQSSSLVSVITISFLSAGLLGLAAGIGIIFGANLGTTTGAWLIAGFGLKVKISAYAMPMLVFGIVLAFQKSKNLKGIGYILAGLGFLFLGIHHMKEGFEAFKSTIDLSEFAVAGYPGLFLFAAIGIFATVVMQSSHATLVLIITALAAQQITYENALALAIGANVGTTITAIIGAMSANVQGKRLAGAHLIFNVVTGVVAIALIYQILELVDWFSAVVGIPDDDYTLKLAVFHTIFNLLGIILMVPFVGHLVRLLNNVMPAPKLDVVEPMYLNPAAEEFPEAIIETVRKEILHLYDNAFEVMAHGISMHRHEILSEQDLDELAAESTQAMDYDIDTQYDRKVKGLYGAIVEFIGRTQGNLPRQQTEQLFGLRKAAQGIVEAIKDVKHLQKNLKVHIASDNLKVRAEYNTIRSQLSSILREVGALRGGEVDDMDLLTLDEIKVAMKESDIILNGDLDQLIRDGAITSLQATSLMNDISYAHSIATNLVDVGTSLFQTNDPDLDQVERLISLDDDEVAEVSKKLGQEA